MVRYAKRLLSIGLLAAAALASASFAGGAIAQDLKVEVGDLNLGAPSGLSALNARIEAVADRVCSDTPVTGSMISRREDCVQALTAQVFQGLSPTQQEQVRDAVHRSDAGATNWLAALSSTGPKAPA